MAAERVETSIRETHGGTFETSNGNGVTVVRFVKPQPAEETWADLFESLKTPESFDYGILFQAEEDTQA
jgi:hypothetical protein